jgi:hypothetical protein
MQKAASRLVESRFRSLLKKHMGDAFSQRFPINSPFINTSKIGGDASHA